MSDRHKVVAANNIRIIGKSLCLLVIAIGTLVFLGWISNSDRLIRGISDSPLTDPVTALLFILSGVALWLVRNKRYPIKYRNISQLMGGVIALVGLTKLGSIVLDYELVFSRFIMGNRLIDASENGLVQMAPNTALNFILSGLAIVLIDSTRGQRERTISEIFCIAVSLMSLLNLYGYVYGVDFLIGLAAYIPMSFPGAISFLALSFSVLFLRPHKGSMALLIGENPFEVFVLRILAFILPLLFGWFVVWSVNHGILTNEMGTAVFAVLSYSIAIFLLGRKSLIQYRLRNVRKKAMQQIKKDALRLHSIMNNSGAVIFIRDLKGRYMTVNRQYEMLYDVKKDNIIGKHITEVFPKEMAAIGLQEDEEVIETGRSVTSEEEVNVGDYTYTFLNNKFPLTDHTGQIYAVCGISTDISKNKEYEAELSQKEQRLKAIIENIGEGIVVAEHDGRFSVYNSKAKEILGATADNIPPEQWSEHYKVYYPDGRKLFPSKLLPLNRALKGETTHEVELLIKNPDFPEGKKISITGTPINYDSEKPSAVVVFRDVTQRRKLQKAIEDKEKHLRAIISTVQEGIVVSDNHGNLILMNEAAKEILGEGIETKGSEHWTEDYEIYYPDGETPYPKENLPLSRALQGYVTESTEVVIKPKGEVNGRRIFISGKPVTDDEGKITAGVFDFRDITNCGISPYIGQRLPEKREPKKGLQRKRNPKKD
ncbi:PAS domain S-box protein [Cytophagaceae bacterium ABcell3]|nr:PAS domain S-box protein [Cytophagaceae bacterium ABcell3]